MSEIEELKERIRLLERELELREKLNVLRIADEARKPNKYDQWPPLVSPYLVPYYPGPTLRDPITYYGSGTGNLGAAYG